MIKHRLTKLIFLSFILACLFFSSAYANSENLIPNFSFEDIGPNDLPMDFYTDAYRNQQGYTQFGVSDEYAHSGSKSIYIKNSNLNDSRFCIDMDVEPNTVYKLEGYILAKNIDDSGRGANISIADVYSFTDGLFDTDGEWVHVDQYGKTGPNQNTITVYARLGGYSGESKGKAYFDDISLSKVTDTQNIPNINLWYREQSPKKEIMDSPVEKAHTGTILLTALFYTLLAIFLLSYLNKNKYLLNKKLYLFLFSLVFLLGMTIRLVLAVYSPGYSVDMNCFTGWSSIMFDKGAANFYSSGIFCDYPPFYMYILWLNGLIIKNISLSLEATRLLIKALPILCDGITALLILNFATKKSNSCSALILFTIYMLNPAIIVTGAAWGQIDSVFTLLILLVMILFQNKKWHYSIALYILTCLTKPQALMFAPVALIALIVEIRNVFLDNIDRAERKQFFLKLLIGLVLSIIIACIVIIPFSVKQGNISWLIDKYTETLSSYKFATINTANIYYLLSANWVDQSTSIPIYFSIALVALFLVIVIISLFKKRSNLKESFSNGFSNIISKNSAEYNKELRKLILEILALVYCLTIVVFSILGLSYSTFSTINIVFTILIILSLALLEKNTKHLAFWLGFMLLSIYNLGVRMHERYIFAAISLFIFDYIYNKNFNSLIISILISISMFINTAIVLDNSVSFGANQGHLNNDTLFINSSIAVLNGFSLIFAYINIYLGYDKCHIFNIPLFKKDDGFKDGEYYKQCLCEEKTSSRLDKKDWILMLIVSVVYSIFAFYALGSKLAPQRNWISTTSDEQIIFELDNEHEFNMLYYGEINHYGFNIAVSQDNVNWSSEYPAELTEGQCFRWKYLVESSSNGDKISYSNNPLNLKGKYVRLSCESAGLNLDEIAFRGPYADSTGKKPLYSIVSAKAYSDDEDYKNEGLLENLYDEQNTVPNEPGYFSGTYFDEIYHARTAFEHIHKIRPYETSHPPLGKLLMALGILIYGMTPFGFRFMGVLMGIFMLPALYILAKTLFSSRKFAFATMILFAFDCMHLTQTRIATIDSFPVFFIIVAFLGMAKYVSLDFFALPFKKTLWPLLLSGTAFGLACASKWIGIYAGLGLAFMFFHACIRQLNMGLYARKNSEDLIATNPERKAVIDTASKEAYRRVLFTCIACVLFFIIIPLIIYYLSYIPYFMPSGGISPSKVIKAQEGMLSYHSTPGLGADHPYQSPWYQWPFILKPMWYMVENYEPAGFSSTIFCMGNPALYYVCAITMLVLLVIAIYRLFARKLVSTEKSFGYIIPLFISIGFLSEYLPWVLVPRSMFIYHYFASVPFIILSCIYIFASLEKRFIQHKKAINIVLFLFIAVCGLMFIGFYPYATGVLTDNRFLDFMKWFPRIWY